MTPIEQSAARVIEEAKKHGQEAKSILMHPETAREMVRQREHSRSVMSRVVRAALGITKRQSGAQKSILGLPVIESPHVQVGMIGAQCIMPGDGPDKVQVAASSLDEGQAAQQDVASEDTGVLAELSKGGVTPTTILIKAMEDVEKYRGVVVLRVNHAGDVDCCTNIGMLELQGTLQRAAMWAAGQN